jgi:hypothetical protein
VLEGPAENTDESSPDESRVSRIMRTPVQAGQQNAALVAEDSLDASSIFTYIMLYEPAGRRRANILSKCSFVSWAPVDMLCGRCGAACSWDTPCYRKCRPLPPWANADMSIDCCLCRGEDDYIHCLRCGPRCESPNHATMIRITRDEFYDASSLLRRDEMLAEVRELDDRLARRIGPQDARQRAKERMNEEISDLTTAKIEEERKSRDKQEEKQRLEAQLRARGATSIWAEEERRLEGLRKQVREAEDEYNSDSDSDDCRSQVSSTTSTVRSSSPPGTVVTGWTRKKDSHGKTISKGFVYRPKPR